MAKVYVTIRNTNESACHSGKTKKAIAAMVGCKVRRIIKTGKAYGVNFYTVKGLTIEAKRK